MESAYSGYSVAQALRSGGRESVRRALLVARTRTLALADAYAEQLGGTGMAVRYDASLNPPLWELGHIGWFQEVWIARNRERALGVECDPAHRRAPSQLALADSWYDSSVAAHASRWELALPGAVATRDYLATVLDQTLALLDQLPADADGAALYFFRLVALHEEMHAEAAIYMARSLRISLPPLPEQQQLRPRDNEPVVLRLPAQRFQLGYDGKGFAFDNELGTHDIEIAACEIDAAPVSWARFLPFVAAGGYDDPQCWSSKGWAWRQQYALPLPDQVSADPGAPAVHLSAYEAEAWCRWSGRRLPTEAEWECAALTLPGFAWGQVWEWTATPFQPYPGFVPHPYRDYSQPWFGSRRVLRGACDATAPVLKHPRYRNFFEPQRTDIFAGFRSCA